MIPNGAEALAESLETSQCTPGLNRPNAVHGTPPRKLAIPMENSELLEPGKFIIRGIVARLDISSKCWVLATISRSRKHLINGENS